MKLFTVSDFSDEIEVTLEVDEAKLTVERATEINSFFGNSNGRIAAQEGNVVEAVIRLYGAHMIRQLFDDCGASFVRTSHVGDIYSKELHEEEGWGGADGTAHGWCGIRVVGAEVNIPGFDDLFLVAKGEVPQ